MVSVGVKEAQGHRGLGKQECEGACEPGRAEAIWCAGVRRAVDIWDLSHNEAVGVNHWLSSEARRRKISWLRKRTAVEAVRGVNVDVGRVAFFPSLLFLYFWIPLRWEGGRSCTNKGRKNYTCSRVIVFPAASTMES